MKETQDFTNKLATPNVGHVVHYQAYGTPGGEYPQTARAAIVTGVDNTDGKQEQPTLSLCVLNPTGMFFNQKIPYSATPKPGHWNFVHQSPAVTGTATVQEQRNAS